MQRKLEETERSNRDLLEVVDRMKGFELEQRGERAVIITTRDADQPLPDTEETDFLRDRLKGSRSESSTLQTEVAELRSREATTKVRYAGTIFEYKRS